MLNWKSEQVQIKMNFLKNKQHGRKVMSGFVVTFHCPPLRYSKSYKRYDKLLSLMLVIYPRYSSDS